MPRIATLTAVVAMIVAPTAFAAQASADPPHGQDASTRATETQVHLPSSHANLPSPAVLDRFLTTDASSQPVHSDGGGASVWTVLGLIAGGLAAFAGMVVVTRRHDQLGPPTRA
jgi:hypothetical protein